MNPAEVLDIGRGTILVLLKIGAPVMFIALAVGLVIALFQALTQIQEQTLGFVVKLIVVVFVIFLTARWLGIELYHYTLTIFQNIGMLAQ